MNVLEKLTFITKDNKLFILKPYENQSFNLNWYIDLLYSEKADFILKNNNLWNISLYDFTLTANYINLELNSLIINKINFTYAEKINLFYSETKILNLNYSDKVITGYNDGSKYITVEKLILTSIKDVLTLKNGNFSIPSSNNIKGRIDNLIIKF